jgi:tRNA(Ile)-lysidine synthase
MICQIDERQFFNPKITLDLFCKEMQRLLDFYGKFRDTLQKKLLSSETFSVGNDFLKSVCVAVSGGSDSMALLILTREWAQKCGAQLCCATIDHGLRRESRQEAEFVADFCQSQKINHIILNWPGREHVREQGKLENLAREARYQLISQFCEDNHIPIVLVGHTWNDQLETHEIRGNFGSSWIGLAGMSQMRSLSSHVQLMRPLLHFPKNHLESFLKNQNIAWKIDPMNNQDRFLRVFHRKKIASYGDDKIAAISNEIMEFGKRRNAMEKAAVYFLKTFCEFFPAECASLEKKPFLWEEKSVQAEILKRLIWGIGGKKYAMPVTEFICDQILCGKINTMGKCFLKVKKDKIFVFREKRKTSQLCCDSQNYKMIWGESANGSLNKINLFDVFL